jgi:hypothetical protein
MSHPHPFREKNPEQPAGRKCPFRSEIWIVVKRRGSPAND